MLFCDSGAANEVTGAVRDLQRPPVDCVGRKKTRPTLARPSMDRASVFKGQNLDYDQALAEASALALDQAHDQDQQRQPDSAVLHQFQ